MKVGKSCPTLCDPMDYSLSGPSVHGILQARILEWVAVPFDRVSCQARNQTGAETAMKGCFFVCFVFNFLLSCKDLELYSVDSRKSAKFSMQGNDISRFKTQKDNSRNLG